MTCYLTKINEWMCEWIEMKKIKNKINKQTKKPDCEFVDNCWSGGSVAGIYYNFFLCQEWL